MSGKGDNPRPLSVTPEQFAENFDAIDWNARERSEEALQRQIKAAGDFAEVMQRGQSKGEPR